MSGLQLLVLSTVLLGVVGGSLGAPLMPVTGTKAMDVLNRAEQHQGKDPSVLKTITPAGVWCTLETCQPLRCRRRTN